MLGLSQAALVLGATAFVLGGLVKGIIGLALPLVALSMLVTLMPGPEAIAIVTIPVVASNIFQGGSPAHLRSILRRFWPLLLGLYLGLVPSTGFMVQADPRLLDGVVGFLVVGWTVLRLGTRHLTVPPRHESWASAGVGLVAGVLGGVSGLFGPPIGMYLAALRLPKDFFVAALGVIYFAAGLPLALLLALEGVFTADLVLVSLAACVPTLAGLFLGTWLRGKVDQALFEALVLLGLALLGLNLLREALFG